MAAAHPRLLSRWDLPRAAPQHLRYRSAAWRRGTRLCVRVLPASVVPRSRTHSEMPRVTAPPTASLQGKGAPAFCPDPRFQVKSSQVKSRFKMAVANPPPLVPIAGASDREGRSRRNRHHWIAPSRGIIPIVLFLIIESPQGFNFVPFSGSLLYSNAKPIQADVGCDRGPA